MNKVIINVLKKINSAGFNSYVVGGYVRDKLLGINTLDVDIATNALQSDLICIFPNAKIEENYGSIKFSQGNYNFDITTFREEIKKKDKIEINYVNDLYVDALRRDFTINAIYMDYLGNIIDPLNGMNEINSKTLKIIGNADTRFKEDPLRILRTIRFKTTLNFKIEENTIDAIIKNKNLLNKVSYFRKKEELNKIFISNNKLQGLDIIKKYELDKLLDISFDKIKFTTDPLGIWAQIDFSNSYPFTKQEKKIIESIRAYQVINNENMYRNGLYISYIVGEILGVSKKEIIKLYKNLPIKDKKDIKINYKKIINLGYKESEINDIIKTLEKEILSNKLKNSRSAIINYLKIRK